MLGLYYVNVRDITVVSHISMYSGGAKSKDVM
jgi:hypothetical protein